MYLSVSSWVVIVFYLALGVFCWIFVVFVCIFGSFGRVWLCLKLHILLAAQQFEFGGWRSAGVWCGAPLPQRSVYTQESCSRPDGIFWFFGSRILLCWLWKPFQTHILWDGGASRRRWWGRCWGGVLRGEGDGQAGGQEREDRVPAEMEGRIQLKVHPFYMSLYMSSTRGDIFTFFAS